jgi:chromate reductase
VIRILGIAGSLRKGSYNKALLRTAIDLLPEESELEISDLEGIPLFNQDLEAKMPLKVKEFKAKIKTADAILIATPEYNHSVPGVLKNAIDWASRPYGDNSFNGKPVALMSASIGSFGGSRAQNHLRSSLACLDTYLVDKPEVFVAFADEKIDGKGEILDEEIRRKIRELLGHLVARSKELNK